MPIVTGQITLTDLQDGQDYNDYQGEWRIGAIGQGFDFEFPPAPIDCDNFELKLYQADLESYTQILLNGEYVTESIKAISDKPEWKSYTLNNEHIKTDDVNVVRIQHNGKGNADWGYIYRVIFQYSKRGTDGAAGAAVVYRGEHSSTAIYYNNSLRRDVVKYNSIYYIFNGTDASSGVWSADNWSEFGAQFDSVATSLLLAENANIADWIIKDGKITSQGSTSSGVSNAVLDGVNGDLEFNSDVSKYTSTGGSETVLQTINIKSSTGRVEVRNSDYDTSYISSQGIFSNRAGTQALPLSMGIELKAAVVALGYGDLQKSAYSNSGAICGLYAASLNQNSDPAPSWGAYISKLLAKGLYYGVRQVSGTTYLTSSDSFVSCYTPQAVQSTSPRIHNRGR
ncbi:MAG: hypothetical protein SNI32_06295 [Rikenellaceae bacterium]